MQVISLIICYWIQVLIMQYFWICYYVFINLHCALYFKSCFCLLNGCKTNVWSALHKGKGTTCKFATLCMLCVNCILFMTQEFLFFFFLIVLMPHCTEVMGGIERQGLDTFFCQPGHICTLPHKKTTTKNKKQKAKNNNQKIH